MKSNKKGIAMLVVISLVVMLLILGGAVLTISTGYFGTSYRQIRRARAYYAAEAGIQHALWKCRKGDYNLTTGVTDTVTIQDPNYSHTVAITVAPRDANGLNSIDAKVTY